ncbi:uncharacterized protein VTP21DRAFT_11459 [Calcarisporiella thermophila]|uniref:uncharacterized protein n=1 Tax=Calcarisporiella thermophila TaxID=911321 RepID=UPI0037437984
MPCLGSRKKNKKALNITSPDLIRTPSGALRPGSQSSVVLPSQLRSQRTSTSPSLPHSPRDSGQLTTPPTSLSSAGFPSGSSVSSESLPGIPVAAKTTSRNLSGFSLRGGKIPAKQLRAEFDELKIQSEETLRKLAENQELLRTREAELEALRRRLEQEQQSHNLRTEELKASSEEESRKLIAERDALLRQQEEQITALRQKLEQEQEKKAEEERIALDELDKLRIKNEETLRRLAEKEEMLRVHEQELEKLRLELDEERRVAMETVGEVEGLKEEKVEALRKLAEKEALLSTHEEKLDELRLKLEQERAEAVVMPALEEVNQQLAELHERHEDLTQRLAQKEQELENVQKMLASQAQPTLEVDEAKKKQFRRLTVELEAEREMMARLEELTQELEAQKQAHETALALHEQVVAEKDSLLREHQQALEEMQQSHQKALDSLAEKHRFALEELRRRHHAEIQELNERIERSKHEKLDHEFEKMLAEFEQTRHNNEVQIESLRADQQAELDTLQQSQQTQLDSLRKTQNRATAQWRRQSALFIKPTEAVSWPAPQPLSVLRKTTLRHVEPPKERKITDDGYNLDPESHLVQVYISSVSGSLTIKRQQEEIRQMLAALSIPFEEIDIAASERARKVMRERSGLREVPQVFVGGEYRGSHTDIKQAQDLTVFLQARAQRRENEMGRGEANGCSAPAPTLQQNGERSPVYPLKHGHGRENTPCSQEAHNDATDDDQMFRMLEKELQEGKVDAALVLADL